MLHRLVIAVLAAALVSLALVAGASAARPVFGIVPQDGALPTSGDLDLMPGAGIESMRTMLHWPSIEKTPGEYDWTEADAVIRETTNRGIQPLVFLYGLPEWAAKRDNYPCGGPRVHGLRAEVARDPGGVRGVRGRGGGPLWPRRLVLGGARERGPGRERRDRPGDLRDHPRALPATAADRPASAPADRAAAAR